MQAVGPSSIAANLTASTGRDVSWLAPCRLPCPRLSLTSKRDAKPSAGRRGRELSEQSGRRCWRCQRKCWPAGKAQRDAELRGPYGRLLPGGRWWVRPLPNWLPYLRSEASCRGLLISWLAERSCREAAARRTCLPRGLPWASLDHVLGRKTPLAVSGSCRGCPPAGGLLMERSGERLVRGNAAWDAGARRCIAGASGGSSSVACETWRVNE